MKALVYQGINDLVWETYSDPVCEDGGIVIEVQACGLCGSDMRNIQYGHHSLKPSQVIGHEVVGIVIESRNEDFAVGDWIVVSPPIPCGLCEFCLRGIPNMCDNMRAISTTYPGGFAEKLGLPKRSLETGYATKVKKQDDLKKLTALALAETAASCIAAQDKANVSLGDVVCIFGAGPIGCLQAQIAKVRGARTVIIFDISEVRLNLAKTLNLADIYLGSAETLVEDIRKIVGNRGVDVAIVAAPSAVAQAQAIEIVKKKGIVIFFGGLPATNPMTTIDGNLIHYREITIIGTYSYAPWYFQEAVRLITKGVIGEGLITHIVPMPEIMKALEIARKGESLKVILVPPTKMAAGYPK